jgi:hypothetical protein
VLRSCPARWRVGEDRDQLLLDAVAPVGRRRWSAFSPIRAGRVRNSRARQRRPAPAAAAAAVGVDPEHGWGLSRFLGWRARPSRRGRPRSARAARARQQPGVVGSEKSSWPPNSLVKMTVVWAGFSVDHAERDVVGDHHQRLVGRRDVGLEVEDPEVRQVDAPGEGPGLVVERRGRASCGRAEGRVLLDGRAGVAEPGQHAEEVGHRLAAGAARRVTTWARRCSSPGPRPRRGRAGRGGLPLRQQLDGVAGKASTRSSARGRRTARRLGARPAMPPAPGPLSGPSARPGRRQQGEQGALVVVRGEQGVGHRSRPRSSRRGPAGSRRWR